MDELMRSYGLPSEVNLESALELTQNPDEVRSALMTAISSGKSNVINTRLRLAKQLKCAYNHRRKNCLAWCIFLNSKKATNLYFPGVYFSVNKPLKKQVTQKTFRETSIIISSPAAILSSQTGCSFLWRDCFRSLRERHKVLSP